jgi:hypothetical protein
MEDSEKAALHVHAVTVLTENIRMVFVEGEPWFSAQDVLAFHGFKLSPGALDDLPVIDLLRRTLASKTGKAYSHRLVSRKGALVLSRQLVSANGAPFRSWIKSRLPAVIADLLDQPTQSDAVTSLDPSEPCIAASSNGELWDALCAVSRAVSSLALANERLVEVLTRQAREASSTFG